MKEQIKASSILQLLCSLQALVWGFLFCCYLGAGRGKLLVWVLVFVLFSVYIWGKSNI